MKIPVGYFLINGIASSKKANLVHLCLNHVSKTGVLIKTLTCDGTAANFSMAQCLGASLSLPNLKLFFHNPETGMLIHILLDAAHMLKLCRNTLGDWKVERIIIMIKQSPLNGHSLKTWLEYKMK